MYKLDEDKKEENTNIVFAVSGQGAEMEITRGSLEYCEYFCSTNYWIYKDENNFEWDLEIR